MSRSGSVADLQAALGPLAAVAQDPLITDILVNGDGSVWADAGDGVLRTDVSLADPPSVRRLAVRLAGLAGRRIDDASPWVDGLLPGSIRLHALLPPLVADGAHISLRIPRVLAPTLSDLRQWGAVDEEARDILQRIVERRLSFVVTGGTGSGKSTLLAALLAHSRPIERLLVVEDVRELQVAHPHVVYLQGRTNNVEGRGEVTLTSLVRQSLRMRPDRLIVGEVRGAEVRELLAALNTGHEGGCGTVHANAARDLIPRMEALGALAGMDPPAVHAQLGSAIDVILHVSRRADGRRCLTEVAVLGRKHAVMPQVVTALSGVPGQWARGPGWNHLVSKMGLDRADGPVAA